jgi:hypothetical protein
MINNDLTIDVHRYVDLDYKNIMEFPEYITFNRVDGMFACDNNGLTSLRGCPVFVEGGFYCQDNQLISLEGCPKETRGSFWCSGNKIKFTIDDVIKLCKVDKEIIV